MLVGDGEYLACAVRPIGLAAVSIRNGCSPCRGLVPIPAVAFLS